MPETDLQRLAAEAYVYGYPIAFNLGAVAQFTTSGYGVLPASAFNAFSHARQLAGPQDEFVSVNNDTVYSVSMLDLSVGPVLLHVPDTGGRYYVLQFVDAWTNNFAYVGTRATGNGEGTFLLTPPGWDGAVPAGATQIACPTRIATIVGRWACAGEEDLPAIRALQADLTLTVPADAPAPAGLPAPAAGVPEALAPLESLRAAMAALPPSAAEQEYQQRFAPLGLLDAESPYVDADPALAETLAAGLADGAARVEEATKGGAEPVNGWLALIHAFDYNLDWFEVGTLDDPAWKIADREAAHLMRAVAARVGLWGNHAYEAMYAQVFVDAAGEQLTGAHAYTIRFETPPPVGAFWSLTMYDMPDYYLCANPIDRYSIGDRTPGLTYGDDGSLTLLIGHTDPGEAGRANWLPAPAGDFRPVLRMYMPAPEALDGTYVLPGIERVD